MPQLNFYVTQTRLPLEKVGHVLGGYTMVKNCPEHQAKNTLANPRLQFIQELIINCKQYPAALLRPWGYTSTQESQLGAYPRRTIFFYKHHLANFDAIRAQFNEAADGSDFLWECGCRVRKYTTKELLELCQEPWYPWFGEREAALFTFQKMWKPRRRTGNAEEIVAVLQEAGILDHKGGKRAIAVIKSHRQG